MLPRALAYNGTTPTSGRRACHEKPIDYSRLPSIFGLMPQKPSVPAQHGIDWYIGFTSTSSGSLSIGYEANEARPTFLHRARGFHNEKEM